MHTHLAPKMLHAILPLLILLLTLTTPTLAKPSTPNAATNNKPPSPRAILLSTVQTLTLHATRKTTHRRVPAVPQLTCLGPSALCKIYTIPILRCNNEGSDYEKEDIQWACRAELPEEFKLGGTEVTCEGYRGPEDEWVLKGSCAVGYRLGLTEKGEGRFGGLLREGDGRWGWGGSAERDGDGDGEESGSGSLVSKWFVFAVFGVVVFVIVRGFFVAMMGRGGNGNGAPRRRPGLGGTGGADGGGNDGDDDEPPPPYDSHGFGGRPGKSASARGGSATGQRQQQQQQGWRPGPWTAGLAGAGLGYALGRGQGRTQPRQNTRQGGFFGNGGGPSSSSSTSSSPPTFSGSTHSSTGFGGTSRR